MRRYNAIDIVTEPENISPQDGMTTSEPAQYPQDEQPDKAHLFPEIDQGKMKRIEGMAHIASDEPIKPQKCDKCSKPATKSIIWCEGRAYVPVCDDHLDSMVEHITKENHGPPDKIRDVQRKKADLESDIYQALGEASLYWDPTPVGVFDSDHAVQVGIKLIDAIKKRATEHTGTFIGLMVPPDIAEQIADPEGESADDMHITLFYSKGLTAEQNKKVEEVFKHFWDQNPSLHVKLTKLDSFDPSESSDNLKVIYAAVESPDIMEFHEFLMESLAEEGIKSNSEHKQYTPHVTIKYVEPGQEIDSSFEPVEFDITEYKFTPGKTENTPDEKEAEIGFSLFDLTKNAQDIRIDDYRRMDESYRDQNQSEDPDLHLGSKPTAEADVEAPYTTMGLPNGEMFDKDHQMNIKMHAEIGQGSDPYRIGRLYSFNELSPQHQGEIDLNWHRKKGRDTPKGNCQYIPTGHHFMWIRTTMALPTLVKESKIWYDKNVNKKWGPNDRQRVAALAEKVESGAVMTPLLVSPPGEKNGGLWEGYHRLRAYDMLAYDRVPVLMKVDVEDPDWKVKLAQAIEGQDREPWFCVDLDGTILEEDPNAHHQDNQRPPLGEPFADAARVMGELKAMGRVSIWTARQYFEDDNDDSWKREIADHLEFHGIPFDDIYVGKKPPADAFIDNKNVEFDGDWSRVRTKVQEVMTRGKKSELPELPPDKQPNAISMDAALETEGFAQGLGNGDNATDQYTDVDNSREDRTITRSPSTENLV